MQTGSPDAVRGSYAAAVHGWTALIVTHAFAASFSLVFGAVNLVRPTKGDLVHRTLGKVWLALMYFTVFSSFGIQQLRPGNFSWIHGLSVFTFVTLTLGWTAARQGNRAAHAANMIGTYAGLWGAFIGVVTVPTRLVPRAFQDDWLAMTWLTVGIVVTGLALVRYLVHVLERESSPTATGSRPV